MPTINKGPKRYTYKKHTDCSKAYNGQWAKLRKAYFMQHPLCELCLQEGKTTATQEVHHIKPLSTAKDALEMSELLLDSNNLMALCKACHHAIHNQMRQDFFHI